MEYCIDKCIKFTSSRFARAGCALSDRVGQCGNQEAWSGLNKQNVFTMPRPHLKTTIWLKITQQEIKVNEKIRTS